MDKIWVLVANGSEARLFEMDDHTKDLSLLDAIDHPESRKKGSELSSDRSGHYQGERTGATHGAFNEPIDPKSYEIERFAMDLAGLLEEGRAGSRYKEVVVVASPHFHGLLNKHLNKQVEKMVSHHIEKDYTHVTEQEMLETLRPYLAA
jgi:protein required for attachment to host cells